MRRVWSKSINAEFFFGFLTSPPYSLEGAWNVFLSQKRALGFKKKSDKNVRVIWDFQKFLKKSKNSKNLSYVPSKSLKNFLFDNELNESVFIPKKIIFVWRGACWQLLCMYLKKDAFYLLRLAHCCNLLLFLTMWALTKALFGINKFLDWNLFDDLIIMYQFSYSYKDSAHGWIWRKKIGSPLNYTTHIKLYESDIHFKRYLDD